MKRKIIVIFSTLMIVSLIGCGHSTETPEVDATADKVVVEVVEEEHIVVEGEKEAPKIAEMPAEKIEVDSTGEKIVVSEGEDRVPLQDGNVPVQDGNASAQDGNAPPQDGNAPPQDGTDRPTQPGQDRPMIDMAAAADQLGVTEETLIDALGDTSQGPPDFAAAATTLGITETELMDALGITIRK